MDEITFTVDALVDLVGVVMDLSLLMGVGAGVCAGLVVRPFARSAANMLLLWKGVRVRRLVRLLETDIL
jgi:hypothetical protein